MYCGTTYCINIITCLSLPLQHSYTCIFECFQSDKIKCHTMSVLRPDKNCTDVEDIVFLYRYTSVYTSVLVSCFFCGTVFVAQ